MNAVIPWSKLRNDGQMYEMQNNVTGKQDAQNNEIP